MVASCSAPEYKLLLGVCVKHADTAREELKFQKFENKLLIKIFAPKEDEKGEQFKRGLSQNEEDCSMELCTYLGRQAVTAS
jgi:hypothetical protein